ncbi:MAG TPA: Cys-tRNA(Pro) deacylase [Tissierellaceae bacterium]|nr:Cys-tRNA(Pro) deacylase [Tissierellaceae bacterium]
MTKTNVMRMLDREEISYDIYSYNIKDDLVDGISVAKKIGKDVKEVYKTLVGEGQSQVYVFIIPVNKELDFKKAARVTGEKKIQLVNVNDIVKLTGYRRGGCSPIGMKKLYPSFIQEDSLELDKIIVSAGEIGLQIQINPKDLINQIDGKFVNIIK